MDASTDKIDAAVRADFESLPPEVKVKMLDMLDESGVESREWWVIISRRFRADARNVSSQITCHLCKKLTNYIIWNILRCKMIASGQRTLTEGAC